MATTRLEHSIELSPGNEVTILEHNPTSILDHDLTYSFEKRNP